VSLPLGGAPKYVIAAAAAPCADRTYVEPDGRAAVAGKFDIGDAIPCQPLLQRINAGLDLPMNGESIRTGLPYRAGKRSPPWPRASTPMSQRSRLPQKA
jgi:hypothetical protein